MNKLTTEQIKLAEYLEILLDKNLITQKAKGLELMLRVATDVKALNDNY